jgi:hypothetical protein
LTTRRRRLQPSGGQAVREHPIRLGRWLLAVLLAGWLAIAIWCWSQVRGGAEALAAVSVAASAAAADAVALLALVATVNFIAWLRRSDYVWVLPSDLGAVRPDWLVPLAVVVGVVAGRLFWH